MDVDGVLTDGKLYYLQAEDGKMFETKGFNSHDGLGLHFCHQIGLQTGVISGRNSPAVIERARMLNMTYVYQGLMSKTGAYEEILKDACITDEQVAFIGDDFTDVALMCRSGLGIAVANARPEVKEVAHFVTEASGGQGAVREAIELILKSKGLWESLIANFFNQF
ncbi:MAG: HAD hydrolase family protein [Candidatus Melainabacteria bacterium]|nr:HAD hydrolase family protein [Candidatus Melainabacteria bacterium]